LKRDDRQVEQGLFGSKAFAKHPHPPSQPKRYREKNMAAEVKFKHPQPFTWAQVMDLDIGTISQGTQHIPP
jgi:hypothetical protein